VDVQELSTAWHLNLGVGERRYILTCRIVSDPLTTALQATTENTILTVRHFLGWSCRLDV